MLTLCGFAASNYYLKVKLALLEKGVAFDERLVWVGSVDAAASPLGKVPFIETAQGPLCESEIILDYLEQAYPEHPLVPADAYGAAKVRELARFITLPGTGGAQAVSAGLLRRHGERRGQGQGCRATQAQRGRLCASGAFFAVHRR
jgi:glutathione S-transferase